MRSLIHCAVLLGLLLIFPAFAQRTQRPAPRPENIGPVTVTRGATLHIVIARDPVSIFDYFSDAAKLSHWFSDQAIFEPQIGGRYHLRWKNAEGVWSGVVTEFIRGNTLAFTWQPPDEPYETNVRIKLLAQDTGTMVELAHSGFTSAASLDKNIVAWRFYLENLKSVIETATDRRTPAPPARRPAAPARRLGPRKDGASALPFRRERKRASILLPAIKNPN